jgi:hypothetical protein
MSSIGKFRTHLTAKPSDLCSAQRIVRRREFIVTPRRHLEAADFLPFTGTVL